jgi:hypothetical protein
MGACRGRNAAPGQRNLVPRQSRLFNPLNNYHHSGLVSEGDVSVAQRLPFHIQKFSVYSSLSSPPRHPPIVAVESSSNSPDSSGSQVGQNKKPHRSGLSPRNCGVCLVDHVGRLANPVAPEKSLEELRPLLADLKAESKPRKAPGPSVAKTRATILTEEQVSEVVAGVRKRHVKQGPCRQLPPRHPRGVADPPRTWGSDPPPAPDPGSNDPRQRALSRQSSISAELYLGGKSVAVIAAQLDFVLCRLPVGFKPR